MKREISVVGIGPGSSEWLLPIAVKVLSSADVVIGGKRQLAEIKTIIHSEYLLEGNYGEMIRWIHDHVHHKKIAVAVSGDTGFHSLLGYLKRNLEDVAVQAYPGIGSLQYLFGRLALGWETAVMCSAHGRSLDLSVFNEETLAGILTDAEKTPKAIAMTLMEYGNHRLWMAVGENLSYSNERITVAPLAEIVNMSFGALNAVVVMPESLAKDVGRGADLARRS